MPRIKEGRLLELLTQNGRMSAVNLAKDLGVTETAIRKKMRKLEEKGIIKQYTAILDPKLIGYPVVAQIGIDTMPESYMAIIDDLKQQEAVKWAYTASGDHMIMLECWFRSSEEMRIFIRDIEAKPGVKRTCPAVITEQVK